MPKKKGTLKVCNRGHKFYRSSDCPVCPKCWAGYYKKRHRNDFPKKLAAPALRALINAKITRLADLEEHTEAELMELHGMGPNAMSQLKRAMKKEGLKFKK